MPRKRWPTFGYDLARANNEIMRRTGTYGKLKTPDEVWDYHHPQPALDAQDQPKEPKTIENPCGQQSARYVALKDGTATTSTCNEDGSPAETINAQQIDRPGSTAGWRCANCRGSFKSWPEYQEHAKKALASITEPD